MKIRAAFLVLIIVTGCSQFADKPASPPIFPDTSSVVRIEAVDGSQSISDHAAISEFLNQPRQVKSGWSFTWHTYPTPQKSVFLKDNANGNLCRVDFGPRWIGSNCGRPAEGWPPLAATSSAQDKYFQHFVGAKW